MNKEYKAVQMKEEEALEILEKLDRGDYEKDNDLYWWLNSACAAVVQQKREIDDLLRTNSELVFQIEALRKNCLEMCETIEKNCDHLVEEHERVLKLEEVLKKIANQDYRGNRCACMTMAYNALAKEER